MFNPLVYNQPESFGSLLSSVTSNRNFLDGIFTSFMATSSVIFITSVIVKVIGKIIILRAAANLARENDWNEIILTYSTDLEKSVAMLLTN